MKMKIAKLAAIALFASLFTTNVNAQSVKYPRTHFGIRVGGTFNTVSLSNTYSSIDEKDYSAKSSVTGGLAFDFKIAPIPLYMETGVYYVNRSIECKNDDGDTNTHTVQIPLMLSYHFYIADNVAIQPFAGGYVSRDNDDTGYGLRFGAGINYGRLYANVGYDLEMSDRELRKNRGDYKASGLFATIGFNFAGRR